MACAAHGALAIFVSQLLMTWVKRDFQPFSDAAKGTQMDRGVLRLTVPRATRARAPTRRKEMSQRHATIWRAHRQNAVSQMNNLMAARSLAWFH